jgi:hypothetical protein
MHAGMLFSVPENIFTGNPDLTIYGILTHDMIAIPHNGQWEKC